MSTGHDPTNERGGPPGRRFGTDDPVWGPPRREGDPARPGAPEPRPAGGGPSGPGPGARSHGDRAPGAVGAGPWGEKGEPGGPEGPRHTAPDEPAGEGTILADVAALTIQRDEYLGALQRLQADFENYRKRVLRQQEEQSERAAQDLVSKLLPVLDTLDLAEDHLVAGQDDGVSAEGKALSQARAMLIDSLGKEGLERVDQAGVAFDPVVHDAVAHAAATEEDDPPGATVVDEVMRSGYRWRGHVLRPAMVRVRG